MNELDVETATGAVVEAAGMRAGDVAVGVAMAAGLSVGEAEGGAALLDGLMAEVATEPAFRPFFSFLFFPMLIFFRRLAELRVLVLCKFVKER